jgi:hypothetical protein
MTASALKAVEPTDPRAGLRAAIQALAIADKALKDHDAAVARAEARVSECEAALEAARNEIEAAKDRDAEAAVAAVASGAPMPQGSTREARLNELSCADDLQGSEAAVVTLEKRRPKLIAAMLEAQKVVHGQVNCVTAPIIAALTARAAAAYRETVLIGAALDVLLYEVPLTDIGIAWPVDVDHIRTTAQVYTKSLSSEADQQTRELRQKFETARKLLHTDPDAPLPVL